MNIRVTLTAAAAALALAAPACAQGAADVYKGKTVTLVAGSSTGGGLDVYARLLSRHLARHIPGQPTVVVQNMPGAGSLTAARHLYAIAPRDGTHMGIVLPGALLDPLLAGQDLKSYDPTKFNYIINGNAETIVCVTRRDAPVTDFAQVFDTELVVGGTGPGSSLVDYPIVTRTLLGAKVKLIAGYKGSREVSLAVQQGEVHGVCGLAWSSAKQQYPDVFKPDGLVKVLVQEDATRHPELIALNAPLSIDYAKSPEQRTALEIFYSQGLISRPFIAPPGVPAERVALLRKAFAAAIADPELQSEAERSKIDARPNSGEEVQALVEKIYASPKPVIDMLRDAVASKK
ncbi:MAG: Tripartite-type tricarboxylate transporter, receptor component TctC [Hyphomicrobiales bacterium]|nr:Tripartite-type tricarboxylate transporter, receptor component TctC [Hyphomicrobiales bacterium]